MEKDMEQSENAWCGEEPALVGVPVEKEAPAIAMFDLLHGLQVTARTLRKRWNVELRAAVPEMNADRAAVLMQLARTGGASQVRLARLLGFTPMALTRTLDDLERLGLVQREPVPVDRRIWAVRLTTKGRETLAAIYPKMRRFIRRHCAGIDEGRRAVLIATLAELKSNPIERLKEGVCP